MIKMKYFCKILNRMSQKGGGQGPSPSPLPTPMNAYVRDHAADYRFLRTKCLGEGFREREAVIKFLSHQKISILTNNKAPAYLDLIAAAQVIAETEPWSRPAAAARAGSCATWRDHSSPTGRQVAAGIAAGGTWRRRRQSMIDYATTTGRRRHHSPGTSLTR